MRDPVARLVHELLWSAAPKTHREVVAAEYQGPFEINSEQAHRLDALWVNSLAAWASRFEAPEFWAHAKERVQQIDDPRLTTGTVRRMRDHLPRHIAAVTADLAVRAAALDYYAADRLVQLLNESPFSDDVVDDVLREAIRPAERVIRATCTNARDGLLADENRAASLADEVLAKVAEPMRVVEALMGNKDSVTVALSDDIALVVNNCAVAHHRVTERPGTASRLLARAKPFAYVHSTVELIDNNIEVIAMEDLTKEMHALCERGHVNGADRRRRALLNVMPEGDLKDALREIPPNDKRVAAEVRRAPVVFNLLGVGTTVVHRVLPGFPFFTTSTVMLSLLFIPLLPITAYLTSYPAIIAKVPLSAVARWWRFVAVNFLLAWLIAGMSSGPPAMSLLIVYAISLAFVAVRWLRLRTWALRKVGR
jgi:hypothetical protein